MKASKLEAFIIIIMFNLIHNNISHCGYLYSKTCSAAAGFTGIGVLKSETPVV